LTINQSVGAIFERFDNAPHTPDVIVAFNKQELVIYMAPHNQWIAGDFHARQFLLESEKQRLDVDGVQKHRQSVYSAMMQHCILSASQSKITENTTFA